LLGIGIGVLLAVLSPYVFILAQSGPLSGVRHAERRRLPKLEGGFLRLAYACRGVLAVLHCSVPGCLEHAVGNPVEDRHGMCHRLGKFLAALLEACELSWRHGERVGCVGLGEAGVHAEIVKTPAALRNRNEIGDCHMENPCHTREEMRSRCAACCLP